MAEVDTDGRTPAEIEEDIRRRRERLAETLDEIGVRMHPRTIVGDARARVAAGVDRSLGRMYASADRVLSGVQRQFVTADGAPRLDRIVPAALLVVGLVGLLAVGGRRRGR